MYIVKFSLVFLILLVSGPMVAVAQNKVADVPLLGDTANDTILVPIVIPGTEAVPVPVPSGPAYLDQAFGGKRIVWNRGWDTSIGHRTQIDPTVQISFGGLSGLDVTYNGPEITHWGEQTYFDPPNHTIYAKAVLLIERGNTVEGGPFEWSLNRQSHVSLINIIRTDVNDAWVRAWADPRRGEKVWYFLMSDDERFASNAFSFTWPF